MNPCHIYWNDIVRTNNINIHNEEEINFVRGCISKWYKQLLNLIKQNIRNKLLHPQLEVDYYNILNNYRAENIAYELHKMTTKKYKLDLAINPKIIEILEIMRKKVYEYESLKPEKDPDTKYKEKLKKFRRRHKEIFRPVLGEFLEKEAPYLRELEDFKVKTGYIDYSQLPGSINLDGKKRRSKKRSKRRSKKRSKKRSKRRSKI